MNPNITYNTSHIVYIKVDVKGEKELQELFQKLQKPQIGFKKY